jgi:hypothetical protein
MTTDLTKEIQQRVNLTGVRLVRGQFALLEVPAVTPAEWEVDLNARVGGRKAPTANGFIQILAGLDVTARPQRPPGVEKAPAAATISADFAIDYRITDEPFYASLKDADVLQFGARNGMYNAWPYLRAHVQAVAAEMMLPVVLPTLRIDLMFPQLPQAVEQAIRSAG